MSTETLALFSIISGFAGIVVGAWLTWKFQWHESQRREKQYQINKFRHAMVIVAIQYEAVMNLWVQFLAEKEKAKNRHRFITFIGDHADHHNIDISEMSFLVDINQPQLLQHLVTQNWKYQGVIGGIKFRNTCIKEMRALSKTLSDVNQNGVVEAEIPVEQDYLVKAATDNLYESAESSMKSSRLMVGKLQEGLKTFDSKAKPIKVEIPDYRDYFDKTQKEKTRAK